MDLKRPHECHDLVLLKSSFNPEKKWGRLGRKATCQVANVRCNTEREDPREDSGGTTLHSQDCAPVHCHSPEMDGALSSKPLVVS